MHVTMDTFTTLMIELLSAGGPFSPTAACLRHWLAHDARLQIGSAFVKNCDRVWIRPLKPLRWSVVFSS
jgi:hypothetical protein